MLKLQILLLTTLGDLYDIEVWLTDDEIDAIKKVLIPSSYREDMIKWAGSFDGSYYVKRGYSGALFTAL